MTYAIAAIVVSVVVFTFAVWLPNTKLIIDVLVSETAPLSGKLNFLFSLYGSIATNFTLVSATYTILIAILFGVNVALIAYYIKERKVFGSSNAALSVGGLVSGVFGIGCAACGTFLLTSFLTLFGATGVISVLPFGGEEFGFIGVGLLAYSVFAITKKISEPIVCLVTDL
jgi:hypothetical protein